ncbi:MAG: hypothetical protein H6Q78_6 [Candidatus Krumholzibacteriota bacterium]|nr:hypothetical protein [Candidatus Krumholzibacteriota bacterium]
MVCDSLPKKDGLEVCPIHYIESAPLMNPKASAILEKAHEERRRSNFKKAIDRLEEGVEKFPREFDLYTEAIDVGMEAGESLRAIQIYKKAQHKFPEQTFEVWTFAAEKVGVYNDSIMGRFLVEQAVKAGDLAAAASILQNLKDHAVSDLLERIRIKKQTMTVASSAGSSGRGEIASFTLTEALLSLRLGRMQAAMDTFVAAIAEDNGTAQRIEPFLAELENRGEGKGETAFALGCCHLSREDFGEGIAKLAHAARSAPALAPRVAEKIESLGDGPGVPLDLRDLTLAQLYLVQGEKTRAAQILKGTIERTPGRAADAVDLLRSAAEIVDDDLETQFVFVEAALTAGRRETALGQLRKIHKDKRHSARLVEWLESRSQSQSGSAQVQLFFAETALNEGLFGKAIEIFKEILSRGPQDEAIIRELLSRHQSVAVVRTFYNQKFSASRGKAKKKAGAFELERNERQGFQTPETELATETDAAPEKSDDIPIAAGSDSFGPADALFRPAAAGQRARGDAPASDFDNHEFSLSMHDPADDALPAEQSAPAARAMDAPPPTAPAAPVAPAPEARPLPEKEPFAAAESAGGDTDNSDFFEYLKRHSTTDEAAPAVTSPPVNTPSRAVTPPPIDTPPRTVAPRPADAPIDEGTPEEPFQEERALFAETGPAHDREPATDTKPPARTETFAETGSSTGTGPEGDNDLSAATEPETDIEPEADTETEENDAIEGDTVAEEEEYRDFDSLYRAALDGRLDHARMLDAAGRALEEGRMEEMKRLLSFDPANLGEDIARKYQLARYYLEKDQPLPALVALKTVLLNSLGREERREFMLRIAECYRGLHNFDAAHGVYLRIMTENPGLPEAEALARANYARYVESETGSAAALEKTTTL